MEAGVAGPWGEADGLPRVLVASSEAMLQADRGDLWDTDKAASDQSIQIAYGGKALGSREPCYWKGDGLG